MRAARCALRDTRVYIEDPRCASRQRRFHEPVFEVTTNRQTPTLITAVCAWTRVKLYPAESHVRPKQ